MNTKTTIAVLLIAAALGIWVYFVEMKTAPTGVEPGDNSGQPLFRADSIDADKITTLRIALAGESPVVIRRDGKDGWKQVEPIAFALEPTRIDEIVGQIVGLTYSSKFVPADKDYGLEPLGLRQPSVTLSVEGDGQPAQTVAIGRQLAGGRCYLSLGEPAADRPVYAAPNTLRLMLVDRDLKQWRQRTLAPFADGSVRRVTLRRDGEEIVLTSQDGRWTLESPVTGRAGPGSAVRLARTISRSQVQGFVADHPKDLAKYGLDKPRYELEVEVATAVDETETHRLRVGNAQGLGEQEYFAMYNDVPAVFTLPTRGLVELRAEVDSWRDARLTTTDRVDVERVALTRGDTATVSFVRDGDAWAFGEPKQGFEPDAGVVDQLLNALFNTAARRFVDVSTVRLKPPLATAELSIRGSDARDRLDFHEHDTGYLLVVRGGESTGHVVERSAFRLALADPIAFRDRTVLPIKPAEIVEIRMQRTGAYPATYHLKRRPAESAGPPVDATDAPPKGVAGDWDLEGYDEGAVAALLRHLAPLRTTEWFAEPQLSVLEGANIQMKLADGAEHRVSIVERLGSVEGIASQFRVKAELASAVKAELRDKVLLKIDAAGIASIANERFTVDRASDGSLALKGTGVLDEAKAAAWFDTMSGLTVLRYVDEERATRDPIGALTIKRRDGGTHRLRVWAVRDGTGMIQLDETCALVPPQVVQKLLTDPVK